MNIATTLENAGWTQAHSRTLTPGTRVAICDHEGRWIEGSVKDILMPNGTYLYLYLDLEDGYDRISHRRITAAYKAPTN